MTDAPEGCCRTQDQGAGIVAAIKAVKHRIFITRLPKAIENQVGTLCGSEDDAPLIERMGFNWLSVERHDKRLMPLKLQAEDPRIGGVDR